MHWEPPASQSKTNFLSFCFLTFFFFFAAPRYLSLMAVCSFSESLPVLLSSRSLRLVSNSFLLRRNLTSDKDFSVNLWRRSNSGSFWILPCWKISLCFARCSSARFLASSASFCLFARAILAFSSLEINFGLESSSSLAFLASIISSSERGVAF